MVKPERPADFLKVDQPLGEGVVRPLPIAAPKLQPPKGKLQKKKGGLLKAGKRGLMLLFIFLPTAIAAIYYFLFAADIYVTEARFIVRSSTRSQSGGLLGQLMQTTGFAKSDDDTFAVHDYIMSRDALRELMAHQNIRAVYSRPEADFFMRHPGPLGNDTFESLFDYYQNRVSVTFDHSTGISTLKVKTFRPEDSKAVSLALLNLGEEVVNRLNQRERQDAIDTAAADVTFSEKRVVEARTKISDFRQKETQLDPARSSSMQVDLIGKLEGEATNLRSQLNEIIAASPNSPNVLILRNRITAVEGQINAERVKSASSVNATKLADYERLQIEREFADKAFASATASLETARIDAQRRQLYLARVVLPDLADMAALPNRWMSIFTMFITTLLLYGVSRLFIAGVKEHAEA